MSTVAPVARLRRSTAADTETLVPLCRAYTEYAGDAWDETRLRTALHLVHAHPDMGGVWLIEHAGAPVGYVVLAFGFSLEFGGRDAFVDELFIQPDARGRGIGSRVMDLVEAEARAQDIRALHLEVHADNVRAIHVYRRRGFAHREQYHLMSKRLDTPAAP